MADVAYSSRVKYVVFYADWHSKKGRQSVIFVISESPAPFLGLLSPDAITFFGFGNCFIKHLVHDIVVSEADGGGPFDEG